MKTLTMALGLSLLTVAAPALADDGPGERRMRGDGPRHEMRGEGPHHGMRGEGGAFRMGRMFERLDANDDDVVSLEEFTAGAGMRFDEADADDDGVVTRDEAVAAAVARATRRAERMAERFLDRLDANDDGTVTREEFDAHTAERFAALDRDEDGELTPGEGMGRHGRHGGEDGERRRHRGWDD